MSSLNFKPIVFDLSCKYDRQQFKKLLENNSMLTIKDELNSQIRELVKLKNPKAIKDPSKYEALFESFISSIDLKTYGNWVYYPWNKNIIRTLPESDFIEVRTIRNKFKITKDEQNILKDKVVGIVGLSVGQSVSLAIAMERIAGEIRIADFDHLELGNMNRIRTGLHNLGLPKTVIVAREIAEIDPYINVECYHEGVTTDNLDVFFESNGKQIDLLIDECDSIDVKIALREKARAMKTPVLMDTSDRGMLDVERFDLDSEMDLFHGLVNSADLERLKHAKTPDEKVDIVGKILNVETMSNGLKNSMDEIGKTITTWPQLGADVMLGGAITAMMSRKILLDKTKVSGRFFMDLDELINAHI
ncbi:MAG: ThiF family adenylyltransferase [Brumimicrobium sp.]